MNPPCPRNQCRLIEYRVKTRNGDDPPDDGGGWIKTECEKCGRFFGHRPVKKGDEGFRGRRRATHPQWQPMQAKETNHA